VRLCTTFLFRVGQTGPIARTFTLETYILQPGVIPAPHLEAYPILPPDSIMAKSYHATTTASEVVEDLSQHINGKCILTTGVSPTSLGATFVETIARAQPAFLILAGRDTTKLQRTADAITKTEPQIQVRLLQLDLGSLAAVRKCAAEINSWADVSHIDVLVNSAGIMATNFALSPEGYESQLATNHLGHFLFTNLIMDKILASKTPRVVNISSDGHRLSPIRFGDYNFGVGHYCRSSQIRIILR